MSDPTGDLRRLRRRLTLWYSLTSALAVVLLALVVTVVERHLRDQREVDELVGWAGRAASLVDDSGRRLDPHAIADDVVAERVWWAAFAPGDDGRLVLLGGRADLSGALELARRATADAAERGTPGEVRIGGQVRRAAAMPLFVDDTIGGAVVVAARRPTPGNVVARWTWIAAVLLVGAVGVCGWWLAGRSIRPAAASLRQRDEFLTAAAHELRTPLARVQAVAEDVATLVGARPTTPDALDEARARAARLVRLTEDAGHVVRRLLLVAQVDAGRAAVFRQRVDVADVVRSVLRAHPDVVVDTEPAPGAVDRELLAVAVENLVINAERHGAGASEDPRIEVTVRRRGTGVVVTVQDSGPGVAEARREDVFERFRTDGGRGTGVGLWLVRWVAQAHGGTARLVGSRPGAIFEIELPGDSNTE